MITFRKYKGIDLESFKRDLDSSSLCQSTPGVISGEGLDELARDYNNTLSALVDRHAPLKSKRVRSRPEINAAKKLRRKAETVLAEDWATRRFCCFQSTKESRNVFDERSKKGVLH